MSKTSGINKEEESKFLIYKETSSGYTSALQMVDKTSAINFFPESTDASRIPRIEYP